MKGKFPDYGVGDIAKELGKRWGVNVEKPRFEAMALKDKTRYAKVSVGCARVDVTIYSLRVNLNRFGHRLILGWRMEECLVSNLRKLLYY